MKFMGIVLGLLAFFGQTASAESIVLYSVRSTDQVKALVQEFQAQSGIQVQVVGGTHEELAAKLQQDRSQADLFLTKDISYLEDAVELGLYEKLSSAIVNKNIPGYFRHPQDLYTILSFRARIAMVHKDKAVEVRDYEDLGSEALRGRLCVRNGENSYNIGMVSAFLKHFGEERTRSMLSAWLKNLAVAPLNGDTKVLEAIRDGVCDVGVANTYYLAAILAKDPNFPVRPVFLNQDAEGAFVNGYGVGIVKGTAHKAAATKLVEFLTTKAAQEKFTAPHFEYPANPEAMPVSIVQAFGRFNIDNTNVSQVGTFHRAALQLIRELGYK